jgi:hypothetical protein
MPFPAEIRSQKADHMTLYILDPKDRQSVRFRTVRKSIHGLAYSNFRTKISDYDIDEKAPEWPQDAFAALGNSEDFRRVKSRHARRERP